MDLAPSIAQLQSTTPREQVNEVSLPSVQLVGCGGCGANIVLKIARMMANDLKFDTKIPMSVIDTSASNVKTMPEGVVFNAIDNLGSGKDRKKNKDSIIKYLDTHPQLFETASDISILVFSLAGGSGSVIAPLYAHRLMRHSHRAVILVAVADDSSEVDVENTINTIKSCSNIAAENKYYLPTMLFSNIGVGRFKVDKSIVTRLIMLLDMLTTTKIEELDYTDRMNFLRPTNIGCPCGVYQFTIQSSSDKPEDKNLDGEPDTRLDKGDMVHALLVVNDSGLCPSAIRTHVTYTGLSETKNFLATVGLALPEELIKKLNIKAEDYKNVALQTDENMQSFNKTSEVKDKTGIILSE